MCILILYPAILVQSVISSRSIFFILLDFLHRWSCYLQGQFYIFLTVCIQFTCSSCLFALARISRTMLKRSGKREHPCLLPDLEEKFDFFTRVVNFWDVYILRRNLSFSNFYLHSPIFNIFSDFFSYICHIITSSFFLVILLAIVPTCLLGSQRWKCNPKSYLIGAEEIRHLKPWTSTFAA